MLCLLSALLGCSTRIQHGLDERQANELAMVLEERGVRTVKALEAGGKKQTWALEVDTDQAMDAVRILAELGLPRPAPGGFDEIYGKGSLVPSPSEERALYVQALSGEVARTLESVDGVVSARVHLVLPASARSGEGAAPAKAAAFLRVRPGQGGRVQAARSELKSIIASSVEGLSPEAVSLMVTEVASTVTVKPAPSASGRMRGLLIALGVLTTALGLGVMGLVLFLRRSGRPGVTRTAPVPSPGPAVLRKVA